jgi:hypothetical protein
MFKGRKKTTSTHKKLYFILEIIALGCICFSKKKCKKYKKYNNDNVAVCCDKASMA